MSSIHPIGVSPARGGRLAIAAAALAAYAAFVVSITYLVGWLADVGTPTSVDRGAGLVHAGPAWLVDLLLVAAFGVQHSLMARAAFKRRLVRVLPAALERSAFVLASALALALVFLLWRPMPAILWEAQAPWAAALARAAFVAGLGLALASTFAISHRELFGIAVVHARWAPTGDVFRTPLLYRVVRHPMHAGMLVALWATPRLTLGHLLFAAAMTAYVLVGIRLEERDLVRTFGARYLAYRARVPSLVPLPRRRATRRWTLAALAAILALPALASWRAAPRATDAAGAPAAVAPHARPALGRDSVFVDGRFRTFGLYVPPAEHGPLAARARRPLLVVLHGSGGDGAGMRAILGDSLERLADRQGLVVAYPDAWRGSWNGCRRDEPVEANRLGVDDVAFVRALVAHLAHAHEVEARRVGVLGFSGGGHMAFRLALEAPDVAPAIATFGASLPTARGSDCRPVGRPVRAMLVHGTDDLVSPYEGGTVIGPLGAVLGDVMSAPASARWLARHAGLHAEPTEARTLHAPRRAGDTGVEVQRWMWRGQPEVLLYTIVRGGHTIPGPGVRLPAALGRTERRWDAVAEAVAFVARE